jgi:HEAT repeat protein
MEFLHYLVRLKDKSTQLSVTGLQHLDALTPDQVEAFRSVWPEIEGERRRQVVHQLTELAEDNVDLNFDAVFIAALDDEDAAVRSNAMGGLWEYEGHDLIARLLRLLERDEEPGVRTEAALALGHFVLQFELGNLQEHHFQKVEQGLRRALEDDLEVEEVRARALEAIGACDRPWVREAIQQAYEGEASRLKVSSLHAMGRSCEPLWLPVLIDELGSDDPEIRYESAVALGSLEDRTAVSHLATLLHDSDPEVKEATIAALGQIGGREAKDLLRPLLRDPSPSVQSAAAAAVAEADFAEDPLTVEYKL